MVRRRDLAGRFVDLQIRKADDPAKRHRVGIAQFASFADGVAHFPRHRIRLGGGAGEQQHRVAVPRFAGRTQRSDIGIAQKFCRRRLDRRRTPTRPKPSPSRRTRCASLDQRVEVAARQRCAAGISQPGDDATVRDGRLETRQNRCGRMLATNRRVPSRSGDPVYRHRTSKWLARASNAETAGSSMSSARFQT